jgi:protein arginine kinase activator
MILCNFCAKHTASVYFKGIVNDLTVKLHLCETCAKKKGMVFPFGQATLSLGEMVAGLAATLGLENSSEAQAGCSKCGLPYTEFKATSQLGCSECYKAFAPVIGPLLERIQGSTQHVGKTFNHSIRHVNLMQELARLKLELHDAIEHEAYEQAALIRDQIREVERKLTAKPHAEEPTA